MKSEDQFNRRITTNQGSLTKELKAMFGYLEWGMLWNREE